MKLTISFYVYGPGLQSGWTPAAQQIVSALFPSATFATPSVSWADATVSNIRRESATLDDGTSVADDGLTAEVTSSLLPRGSETALFIHPTADAAGRAATTAELTELRTWIGAITRVTKFSIVVTVPSATDAQIRTLRLRLNANLGAYLLNNGRFLLSSSGVRVDKSSSSSFFLLFGALAGFYLLRKASS